MLKLMGKKIFTLLRSKMCLSKPMSRLAFSDYAVVSSFLQLLPMCVGGKVFGLVFIKRLLLSFQV